MTNNSLESIALQWFDAFNTHNLEQLLSLYHDNAEHYSPKLKILKPETKGYIKGKEELKLWWADAFERLPSLQYKVINTWLVLIRLDKFKLQTLQQAFKFREKFKIYPFCNFT